MFSFFFCFLSRGEHVFGLRLLLVNMFWKDRGATLLSYHHLVVCFYRNSLFLIIGYCVCITMVSHKPCSASQSPYNMNKPDLALHGGQVSNDGCAGYLEYPFEDKQGKSCMENLALTWRRWK
jgi:hypothetical protein